MNFCSFFPFVIKCFIRPFFPHAGHADMSFTIVHCSELSVSTSLIRVKLAHSPNCCCLSNQGCGTDPTHVVYGYDKVDSQNKQQVSLCLKGDGVRHNWTIWFIYSLNWGTLMLSNLYALSLLVFIDQASRNASA